MKNFKKVIVLFGILPMILTSCQDFEKKSYCLETSNEPEYVEGTCYQVSRKDILETVHLINLPVSVDEGGKNPKYDIEWKQNVPLSYFTFTDGLEGKKIKSIITLGENIIRLIIFGNIRNDDAAFGYIRVNKEAFIAKNNSTRDAYLYAYLAVGENSAVVAKPDLNLDE